MSDETSSRFHAIVVGRVQGVSFRYFVLDRAESLEISGWVRNLWNGNVEVMAEGSPEKLEKFLEALHVGPPMASVEEVKLEWQVYSGEFHDFQIRSTTS